MSTNVTHSEQFNQIHDFNPKEINAAKRKNSQKIVGTITDLVSEVIGFVQTSDGQSDMERVARFSEQVGVINEQFSQEGKGVPFATHLFTLNLLSNLKTHLPPTNQEILQHPLLKDLKAISEQEEIEAPLDVATGLLQFQKNILNPALARATTPEEVRALRPVVQLCLNINERVQAFDETGTLQGLSSDSLNLFNYKFVQTSQIYQFVIPYEAGSISNLQSSERREQVVSKLTKLQTDVAKIADGPHMSTEDKVAFYDALIQIQKEFGENGAELDPVINALAETLELHDGIKSAFVLELKELSTADAIASPASVVTKLKAFEQDHLIPALENVTTREELNALEPLVDQCIAVQAKVGDSDGDRSLQASNSSMINLYNAKLHSTTKYFPFLLSYEKGDAGDLSEEARRGRVATTIGNFIENLIPTLGHPLFSSAEKQTIYNAVITLQGELEEHGDGKLLEPTAKALREALGIPEPKKVVRDLPSPPKVSSKKNLFAIWEARSSQDSVRESPSPTRVRKRQELSPQAKRERSLQVIHEKLAGLDVHSLSFSDDVTTIKREISKLRSIPEASPTEFAHLERALQMLLDPGPFRISKEENTFMHHLAAAHQISEVQLRDYANSEQTTVNDAQSSLLRALKRDAARPDRLDATAYQASHAAIAAAKQSRFRHFTDVHSPNPALNHNFTANFPTLVATFEMFSREVVSAGLESSWGQMESLYDAQSAGQFSRLIGTYSYIDPRQQFSVYRFDCEEEFFKTLDLSAIDRMESGELSRYLEEKVESKKNHPAELFEVNYNDMFSEQHLWLFDNLSNLKDAYNQGDEGNTNLGAGVCYNNCLDRISKFVLNPTLDRSTITMGSNAKTRFHQATVKQKVEEAKKGAMTWDEASQAIKENCSVYGLALHYSHDVSKDGNVRKNLSKDLTTFSDMGYKQGLLSLRVPGRPGGHAINLHFDKENGAYGFEDDNIGRVEFDSLATMKTQLKSFLKQFYPQHTNLGIDFYRQA